MKKYAVISLHGFGLALILYAIINIVAVVQQGASVNVIRVPEMPILNIVAWAVFVLIAISIGIYIGLSGSNLKKVTTRNGYIVFAAGIIVLLYDLFLLQNAINGQMVGLFPLSGQSLIPLMFQNAVAYAVILWVLAVAGYYLAKYGIILNEPAE